MKYADTTTSGQRRELARKIFEEVRNEQASDMTFEMVAATKEETHERV